MQGTAFLRLSVTLGIMTQEPGMSFDARFASARLRDDRALVREAVVAKGPGIL